MMVAGTELNHSTVFITMNLYYVIENTVVLNLSNRSNQGSSSTRNSTNVNEIVTKAAA
jgi:hypothetical protein